MILAFDIGGSNARYAVGKPDDLDMSVIDSYDSSMSYKNLLSTLKSVIEHHNPDRITVSVPGPIHPPGIVSPKNAPSPNISWEDEALQNDLNDIVKPPVKIQRDLHCAAQGIIQIDNTPTFTLLYPGTGFGYATALQGEVITGTKNTAGELATALTEHGTYDEALCLSAMTELDEKQRAPRELLGRMEDPAKQYLNRLVQLTAPLIRTTAPPIIYVGGHLAHHWDQIEKHLRREFQANLPYRVELRQTRITPLIGAFTLGSGNIHF